MDRWRSVDLNRIYDFLRIVDLGNITRAAESLGEGKAKLSRNLALLEEELGVQLVYRTTRQFQLTQAGRDFYQQMKENFAHIEDSLNHLVRREEDIVGRIKVTAPEDVGNYILTPIIHEFCNIYPKLEFELLYTNQILDLVKLGVDVAIRIGHLKDSSLIQKKVGRPDFIMVAAPSYLEKARPLTGPEDLEHHATVAFSGTGKFTWTLSSVSAKKTIQLKPGFIANNFISVRDLAVLGRGVAFLPRFLAQPSLERGDLVHVMKHWRDEGAPVQVAMPSQKNIPVRIRKFFDFVAHKLEAAL